MNRHRSLRIICKEKQVYQDLEELQTQELEEEQALQALEP